MPRGAQGSSKRSPSPGRSVSKGLLPLPCECLARVACRVACGVH